MGRDQRVLVLYCKCDASSLIGTKSELHLPHWHFSPSLRTMRSLLPTSLTTSVIAGLVWVQPVWAQRTDAMPSIVDVPGVGLVIYEQVPASDTTSQQRMVYIEGYGNVLVVPVRPDDTRTPRQRCIDEAKKREGRSISALALRAIDLKCSQR